MKLFNAAVKQLLPLAALLGILAGSSAARADELDLNGYQRADGAITIHPGGAFVDPYFATKALLAAHDAGLDVRRAAARWIDWALQRQRPDGGFDRYCRKDDTLVACARADADDAVAAVWIELLAKLAPPEGLPAAWQNSLQRANQLLASLLDKTSNVYFISAEQPVGLLMDNIEVYTALKAMAALHLRTGNQEGAKTLAYQADYLANNIARVFWQPCRNQFRVSTQLHETHGFYPDQVADIFPVMGDMRVVHGDHAAVFDQWLQQNRDTWFRQAASDYPWGLIALAAEKLARPQTVGCWLALARKLRNGKHWNVLEEAAFQALSARGPQHTFDEGSCPVPAPEKSEDTIPPDSPSNLSIQNKTARRVDLNWNAASDNLAVAAYEIIRNGEKIAETLDVQFVDQSVAAGTRYAYAIRARDKAGNVSEPTQTVTAITDTGNEATVYLASDWTSAAIRFAPEGDPNSKEAELSMDKACPGYWVRALDLGPSLGVSVAFRHDAGGDPSQRFLLGTGISVIKDGLVTRGVDPCLDRTPPSTPPNLAQLAVDSGTVKIGWAPASDNAAVVAYKVFRNGAEIARTQDMSHTDTCVSPITTYQYQVSAVDASGNQSPPSGAIIVTTLPK